MSEISTKNIAKNLKELIDFLEITQAKFASEIGVTQAAVSQWLAGEREPSLKAMVSISTTYKISFERLLR